MSSTQLTTEHTTQDSSVSPGNTPTRRGVARPLSVAPMMDWTDRHYRYMMRLITKETLLYTEMITSAAIVLGDTQRLLQYHPIEHPIAIQLGGNDPAQLAEAAKIAEDWGYDEVNLNVGCPSSRVQEGTFGACLMARPELVAEIVDAMRSVVSVPVTVKHRIGIDGLERLEDLIHFVDVVRQANSDRFIVHARIAILGGLSPKQNRTIPPIRYEDVYALKEHFPDLWIEGNGHIKSLAEVQDKLQYLDGLMLGRAAYENPYLFADADELIFGQLDEDSPVPMTRREVVEAMKHYVEEVAVMREGTSYKCVTRHMLNLFKGMPGARRWRRVLSGKEQSSVSAVFEDAMADLP